MASKSYSTWSRFIHILLVSRFFIFIYCFVSTFHVGGSTSTRKYLYSLLSFIQERQVRGKCETAWGSQKLNKKTVLSLKCFQSLALFTLSPPTFLRPLSNFYPCHCQTLSFKNLIPKIKWITPQSSLSSNRNCLFHFHPHLCRGFSQPLPSITNPARSAFVSSENPENHLYSFSSVTVSLDFGEPAPLSHHRFRHPTTQRGNFSFLSVFVFVFFWVS